MIPKHPLRPWSWLALAGALMTLPAQAELIAGDWKTSGDGQAILDSDTGLEWLKITNTHGWAYNQVAAELETTFAGWRLATVDEVMTLIHNAMPMVNFNGKTGASVSSSNSYHFRTTIGSGNTYAMAMNEQGQLHWYGADASWAYRDRGPLSPDQKYTGTLGLGTFLVSDGGVSLSSQLDPSININNPNAPVNVSAPIGLATLGLGLLGWGARRRRR